MKKKIYTSAIASTAAVALLATACGDGEGGEAPSYFSIGTGGTGGTAYPVGADYANIMSNEIDGTTFSAEATGGSVDNVRLIDGGDVDMGQIQADTGGQACTGTGDFEGEQVDLNTYAVLYPNALAFVRLEGSSIDSLSDLAGQEVGVGDQGSGTDMGAQAILGSSGMSYDDINVNYLSLADQATAFRDGQLDAAFWSPPRLGAQSSLIDLASDQDVDWRGFTDEELEAVAADYDYYEAGAIDAGTYEGQDEDFPVMLVYHTYLGTPDLPEEFVYEVTTQIIENAERVSSQQISLEEFSIDDIEHAPCPIHPGAARAYEEAGADIPEDLIASE